MRIGAHEYANEADDDDDDDIQLIAVVFEHVYGCVVGCVGLQYTVFHYAVYGLFEHDCNQLYQSQHKVSALRCRDKKEAGRKKHAEA